MISRRPSTALSESTAPAAEPVLLVRGDRRYLCPPDSELQTDLGVLEIPPDPTPGSTLETHLGTPFTVLRARGPDLFDELERTGSPMLPRDIGMLVGLTGAQSGDRILDAGTGTGILAIFLGRIGATVTTYERDASFAEVARENVRLAGVADRVEVRTGDIESALPDLAEGAGFDLWTLDTPDATELVGAAPTILRPGGYLAVYTPFVEDMRDVAIEARSALDSVRTFEPFYRRMDVDDRGTRPSTAGVGHTGYLTIGRRLE